MTDGVSLGRARCTGRSRTGLALSVVIGRETRWIPTSVIHDDSEVYEPGHEGDLVVSEWYANKMGLSDSPERNPE